MYKNHESLIMYQDSDEYLDIVTFYKADLDWEHFCQRSCRTLVHGLPTKKVETVSLAECVEVDKLDIDMNADEFVQGS